MFDFLVFQMLSWEFTDTCGSIPQLFIEGLCRVAFSASQTKYSIVNARVNISCGICQFFDTGNCARTGYSKNFSGLGDVIVITSAAELRAKAMTYCVLGRLLTYQP